MAPGGYRGWAGEKGLADCGAAAAAVKEPVTTLTVVPEDGGQAKDLLGDGADTVVDVAVRGAPERRDVAASNVGNDLHGPAELADDLLVGAGGHWGWV